MVSHGVPPGKVKVTVNLEAQLVKNAKKAAIDRGLTLGELIEENLRRDPGVQGQSPSPATRAGRSRKT
jgi:hypothetical protein